MKKAQVTIFIVVAVVIIASVLLAFTLRRELFPATIEKVPEKLRPFAEGYSLCLQSLGQEAIQILGARGGYIFLPEREDGSSFMPFGNSLEFLGDEIPYWFYISGNGLEQQRIPSISDMEGHLKRYVEENIDRCDSVITEFTLEGFEIEKRGQASARVKIKEEDVSLRVFMPLNIRLQDTRARVDVYDLNLEKALGRSYEAAKKIMNAENEQLFLEERTIDAIFLYEELPSTKTTLECNPKSYNFLSVEGSFKNVLANNIPFTKIKGTNYVKANPYYEIDAGISDQRLGVNFLFIEKPFKLDINGEEDGLLRGESISQLSQPFLRSFLCLSSYSFAYTVAYPVLVSVYDAKSDLNFQFPFVVFINKNNPREAVEVGTAVKQESKVCKFKLAEETVLTFSADDAKPLDDVTINYKCINTVCHIGVTSLEDGQAVLRENVPQCVNGFIIAEKEGYVRTKEQFSTNIDNQVINLLLEPLNELDVELILIDNLGGERSLRRDETAIITLLEEEQEIAETLLYPENRKVSLVTGFYDVRIQVFKEGSLSLEEQSVEKCFKVPAGGLGGLIGLKEEKCQTFEFPAVEVDQLLFGGTRFGFFAEVEGKNKLVLYTIENPVPEGVDDLNAIFADIALNKNSPLFKEPEII